MGGGLESRWVGRVCVAHRTHDLRNGLLHQAGISDYFMRKMHGQTTLKLSGEVGNQLPSDVALYLRRTDTAATLLRKMKNPQEIS
jgi:hypothetical protein